VFFKTALVHPVAVAFRKPSPKKRRQNQQNGHTQQGEPYLLGIAGEWELVQMPTMRALGQAFFSQSPRLEHIGRPTSFANVIISWLII
jgi:hypothetical protein